jgi:protein-ribulosamine 3-kinase
MGRLLGVIVWKTMQDLIRQDTEKNGYWPEFKIVCDLITSMVIPRLLEPLQSKGLSIKPCLMVDDLWDGKTATDMDTGSPSSLTQPPCMVGIVVTPYR